MSEAAGSAAEGENAMSRLVATLVLALIWVAGALAGGIDDIRLGNEAFRERRPEAALEAYTRAIVSGELDAEALALAYNNRGVVYNELGDYDRAIADYREALALVPGDPTALRNLRVAYTRRGVAAANFGEFERALEDLGRAIELEPSHHLAWLRRAEVRMEMGDLEGAAKDLAEAEARRPGDAEIAAAVQRLAQLEEASRAAELTAASPTVEPATAESVPVPEASAVVRPEVGASTAAPAETAPVAAPAAEPAAGGPAEPATVARAGEGGAGAALFRARVDVNVRAGPGNDHAVVRVARRGQTLRVLGEVRGWKQVQFDDGAKGFVYRKWLEPVAETGERG